MSGQFPPRPSKTEPRSDILGNDSAAFHYDWPGAGSRFPQQVSTEFQANIDPVSGEELLRPSSGEQSINAKVPIPRSAQTIPWTSTSRTSRACENCREQKAKCSGHRPTCNRCKDSGIRCSYGDRKKEKIIKEIDTLKAQIQTYETVLREVYPRLDLSSAQYVDQTIGGQLVRFWNLKSLLCCVNPLLLIKILTNQIHVQPSNSPSFRSDSGAGMDHPLATIDHTEEDFNRDEKQALGFVGEHSEMIWLYRLKRDLDQDNVTSLGETLDRPSISSMNYFQGNMEISVLDAIDVLGMPAQSTADKLVDAFFDLVHPAFPVIGKRIFLSQYRTFYSNNPTSTSRPGKRWMAVLNLIFAIAVKHSLLVNNEPDEELGNHLVYFTRAGRLSLGNVALLDHPNLQQVQVEGLTAFYLLSTAQVNRSWRMIGIAIRSAVAMGLNLRSESDDVPPLSRESRYRVWWALFMLDTLLCVMIGRPPSTGDNFCTTPLPIPFLEEDFENEEVKQLIMDYSIRQNLLKPLVTQLHYSPQPSHQTIDSLSPASLLAPGKAKQPAQASPVSIENIIPNISLYFLYAVDLTFLMREAIETLYAPGATRRSWLEMENAMSTLNNTADNWLSRLPTEFQFTKFDSDQPFALQRVSLSFQFYTTKLVIAQPCLRRLAHQPVGDSPSGSICDTMASMCVQVARDMLSLLPDETDIHLLYQVSPWWGILHYMMQSTTVLLIQLFMRTEPGTTEAVGLTKDIQKAIQWLGEMAKRDASARRALSVCMDILSQHGQKFAMEID
ncbi:uncharacterized protein N7483_008975 [Penicillium malachiteum]|uniref:uncharacterized protein n=1 Tax=Penicillium malachiteum TaxID=1324776 RepID=UPI002546DE5C|nr:uncharacterized protein N7483_008975 [Penicillium malachiteum]KAJ5721041.1 hypothetical protein N7483_008975 [Penicillium malachiteum]